MEGRTRHRPFGSRDVAPAVHARAGGMKDTRSTAFRQTTRPPSTCGCSPRVRSGFPPREDHTSNPVGARAGHNRARGRRRLIRAVRHIVRHILAYTGVSQGTSDENKRRARRVCHGGPHGPHDLVGHARRARRRSKGRARRAARASGGGVTVVSLASRRTTYRFHTSTTRERGAGGTPDL